MPEVIVKALDKISKKTKNIPIIIGDTKTIINTSKQMGVSFNFESIKNISSLNNDSEKLFILDNEKYKVHTFLKGKNSVESGLASHEWVELATDLAIEKKVDSDEAKIGFALFATQMENVISFADKKLNMPPKSTLFDPKPLDGLVAYDFE